MEKLGHALSDLNATGLSVSVSGPRFFLSKLDAVKLKLIKEATQNGKTRAELMASSSGSKLGKLVSARQGVIQITKPNSSEMASWGVYNTDTIDKVVKL
ncbi:MAG: SIMPL domain-containing protein, partial [Persephonella sp.]